MYQFSRSIYRELAPSVLEDSGDPSGQCNKQLVLEACESAMLRLAEDGRYFARPTATLFRDIRIHFPLREHLRVYRVIDCNVRLARAFLAQLPPNTGAFGEVRQCRASTRRGTPCQREPLPGRDYCPSHKHLEEFYEAEAPLAA
jgi:hypothetical protein